VPVFYPEHSTPHVREAALCFGSEITAAGVWHLALVAGPMCRESMARPGSLPAEGQSQQKAGETASFQKEKKRKTGETAMRHGELSNSVSLNLT